MSMKIFTDEACAALRKNLQQNKLKYGLEEKWVDSFFASVGILEPYEEYYELNFPSFPELSVDNDDYTNTKLFYGRLKDSLTPALASMPNLWTTLCHLNYQDYIVDKWKNNRGLDVESHFFASRAKSSLAYYNAVSRYWWAGYLTYDESFANPWELTKVLFSAQQIEKDMTDQPFCMNRDVTKGLMLALRRIQEKKGDSCTNIFRKCCNSYINRYGVVSVLDTLRFSDIEEIAYNYMAKLLNTNGEDISK